MGEQDVDTVVNEFMKMDAEFSNIRSVLPDEPNWEALDQMLFEIRITPVLDELANG